TLGLATRWAGGLRGAYESRVRLGARARTGQELSPSATGTAIDARPSSPVTASTPAIETVTPLTPTPAASCTKPTRRAGRPGRTGSARASSPSGGASDEWAT